MIVPSDPDYQETKRIKLENLPLSWPFNELASHIQAAYDVQVLNIRYDTVMPDDRPRLSVVLEFEHDARKFKTEKTNYFGFDERKQNQVREQFEKIVSISRQSQFTLDRLFVIFQSFEQVARIEANEAITDAQ